jgi:hypothetical protein
MSVKTLKLEEPREGEYETPLGKMVVEKTKVGFRIIINIDEKALGQHAVRQILSALMNGGGRHILRLEESGPLPYCQPRLDSGL